MANEFKPNTNYYGREVIGVSWNDDNKVVLGRLDAIKGPFVVVVSGKEYELGASTDFHADDDGKIYLTNPF